MSYEQFCVSRMFGGSGGILWWFVEVSAGELSSMLSAALTLIATRVNKRELVFALCVSVSLSVDVDTWQSPTVVHLHRRFLLCPRRHVLISSSSLPRPLSTASSDAISQYLPRLVLSTLVCPLLAPSRFLITPVYLSPPDNPHTF